MSDVARNHRRQLHQQGAECRSVVQRVLRSILLLQATVNVNRTERGVSSVTDEAGVLTLADTNDPRKSTTSCSATGDFGITAHAIRPSWLEPTT